MKVGSVLVILSTNFIHTSKNFENSIIIIIIIIIIIKSSSISLLEELIENIRY